MAGFPGSKKEEIADGYKIVRVGNRFSVYFETYKYYQKHLRGWADLIIEEINTFPFLSQLYAREKKILIFYQLCREIWFYQISFPLSLVGYLLEPLYLWLLRKNKVITISASTKSDLIKYGFRRKNINIIPVGIGMKPIENLYKIKKFKNFTLLSLGAIRKMKRPDQQIKTFELAKRKIPELKLKIIGAGAGGYYKKIKKIIKNSVYYRDIEFLGRVNSKKKIEILQKSHLILVTSVKEGWGLIVTEANSQGTPAVVYNIDGLRDSVKNNETGVVVKKNTPKYLARSIVELAKDKSKYTRLQKTGWQWSKNINFENCYQQFLKALDLRK